MKKLIALGLVSLSLSAAIAEARVFVGVDAGYDRGNFVLKNGIASTPYGADDKPSIGSNGWVVGVNVGGEWLFTEYIGLRTFLGIGYGQTYVANNWLHTLNVDLNLDLLVNFINSGDISFGMFVGAGAGINTAMKNFDFGGFLLGGNIPVYGRVGFTTGIGEHNRIDLTFQLPITTSSILGAGGLTAQDMQDMQNYGIVGAYNPLRVTLGYKFIF